MKPFRKVLLLFFWVAMPFYACCQSDSISIFYATGVAELNGLQTARIDSFLYSGGMGGKETVRITAYADEPGTSALNKRIAQQRAVAVQRYLLESGVEKKQILACTGAGNVLRTGADLYQRRTDLIWTRPDPGLAPEVGRIDSIETDTGVEALGRMKPDDVVELKNLLFRVSSPVILDESLPTLNQLVRVLKAYPALKIRLEGHICCGNKPSGNRSDSWFLLSEERAKAVMDFLIAHGIPEARLSYKGLGFSKPKIYPERKPADQERNRRVEIRVMENNRPEK